MAVFLVRPIRTQTKTLQTVVSAGKHVTDGKRAKIKHIIIQWRVGENGDGGKGGKILTSRKCGKVT